MKKQRVAPFFPRAVTAAILATSPLSCGISWAMTAPSIEIVAGKAEKAAQEADKTAGDSSTVKNDGKGVSRERITQPQQEEHCQQPQVTEKNEQPAAAGEDENSCP